MMRSAAIFLFLFTSFAGAFVAPNSRRLLHRSSQARCNSESSVKMITDPSDPLFLSLDEMGGARREFFIWFFGSSGAAAIGRRSFPILYDSFKLTQRLAEENPLPEGEKLNISPVCFYPRDVTIEEIMQVIDNPNSVEKMVQRNPVEGNFLAAKGYLTYDAFLADNKKANPYAIRIVMDTFATTTNVVNPNVAQEKLDSYKADRTGKAVKNTLLASKLKQYSAVFFLLFSLGLADVIAFVVAMKGWFPDWPGRINLPEGLWNPGIWTVGNYLSDYDLSGVTISSNL